MGFCGNQMMDMLGFRGRSEEKKGQIAVNEMKAESGNVATC